MSTNKKKKTPIATFVPQPPAPPRAPELSFADQAIVNTAGIMAAIIFSSHVGLSRAYKTSVAEAYELLAESEAYLRRAL